MYQLSPGVRSTRNEDGGIVLDIEQGRMYRVNATAALILDRIGLGSTKSQIVRDVKEQCGAACEPVEDDVDHLLSTLLKLGVIRILEEQGA